MSAGRRVRRTGTHVVLAAVSAGIGIVASRLSPGGSAATLITDGSGYAALSLLAVSLAIGPWQMLRGGPVRPAALPVNIDLRRDVGIWVGLTGLLHAGFGLTVHFGGDVARYFFPRGRVDLAWLLFGTSNWLGLAAALLACVLLALSNDQALAALGRARWKRWQRLSYPLAGLTLGHTLGYQLGLHRSWPLPALVTALSLAVVLIQLAGMRRYRARSS